MISVITITYNRAELLKETIRSVLNQEFSYFEYLIIDDGSTDNTEEIVKSFNDSRIRYYKLSKIGYLSKLRNYGLNKSTGKYIAFIDSDDLWEPTMLSTMHKALETDKDSGFVMCELIIFNEKEILHDNIFNEKYKNQKPKKYYLEQFADTKFTISLCAMLFRKKCLDETGFFDEQLTCGDKDFTTRLAFHNNSKVITDHLVKIRRHASNNSDANNETSTYETPYIEEIYTLKNFYDSKAITKSFYKKAVAVYYYKLAEEHFQSSKYKKAKINFYYSLQNNSFNARALLKYLLSTIGKLNSK